jgi:TonB-linked SusC/RagA family outer membrane protein
MTFVRRNAEGRRSTMWHVLTTALLVVSAVVPISAQVAYTIFPAISPRGSAAVQPTNPGAALVTLDVRDSTVAYVIGTLVGQAHLRLSYDNHVPLFAQKVTVHIIRAQVMDALALVLKGTGLAARLASDGETVLVRPFTGGAPAHGERLGGTVTGRVTDSASGQGLGGASVKVEGAKLSAVTSDSGHFTLKDVPAGEQVLSVRLFGYKPLAHTITVVDSQQTVVKFVLVPVPTVLSGVVTTATGLQRKVEVGNDITTLNVDSIMQVAPITSVTDLLETRVPGLTVLPTSGTPGDPARIRIRGAGSLNLNNDPIVIVDGVRVYASQSDPRNNNLAPIGVNNFSGTGSYKNPNLSGGFSAPSPLDQIDPGSIETIEVLKGPSASAIYGSDAAQGVIVITTKHGRVGPTRWTLALGQGVNWLPGTWPANYYRFGSDAVGNGPLCNWDDPTCTIDSVVAYQALNDPRYSVFSHGSNQTANLTVSGGTSALTYSVTGSGGGDVGNLTLPAIVQQEYDSAYGPIPSDLVRPDHYTTWGVNGAVTALPSSTLRVTLTSSLFTSAQQQGSLNGAINQLAAQYVPFSSPTSSQPLIQGEVERVTDNQVTATNVLSLHWQPRTWLPLDATGGINTMQRSDEEYIPYGVDNAGPGVNASGPIDTLGYYSIGRGSSNNQTLTVGTTIPLKLVTLAFGGNLYSQSTADFHISTNQLAPGVSVPTAFNDCSNGGNTAINCIPSAATQSTTGQSTYGWYVEPRLNLASRFFVAPGFRLDGGSGASNSAGNINGLSAFPKVDVSWVAVDRQSQRPLWGVLTLLRPRVAIGLAGTQPGPADKLRLFTPGDGTVAGTGVSTVTLSALGNTQLRPERSSELEGGFDATLFRGRLSLTYTQYNKTRTDAILNIPVAPSVSGFDGQLSSIDKNIGEIRNTGTEVTMNATLVQSRMLSWSAGANLSNNNNLVVRLNPGQPPIVLNNALTGTGVEERVTPGYPLFGEWARPILSFADANHDGIIEPNDIVYGDSAVYVGQPNPKYQVNLNTNVTLLEGHLSVTATFAYQNGLTQDNQGACSSGAFELLPNAPGTPLATQAAVVAAGCTGGNDVTGIGLVQTVNTFRFQALSINYEAPRRVAAWFRLPRLSLALQGSNLGLHTNYRGFDPDVNAFSTVSSGDETADLGQIPEPRTWWLKLTMGN